MRNAVRGSDNNATGLTNLHARFSGQVIMFLRSTMHKSTIGACSSWLHASHGCSAKPEAKSRDRHKFRNCPGRLHPQTRDGQGPCIEPILPKPRRLKPSYCIQASLSLLTKRRDGHCGTHISVITKPGSGSDGAAGMAHTGSDRALTSTRKHYSVHRKQRDSKAPVRTVLDSLIS